MAKRYQIDIEDNDAIFDAVEKLMVGNRSKIKKGETITIGEGENAREIKLKNSFIRIPDPSSKSGYKAYAMANKRYNAQLGEGAYGKVKLAQDKAGHNFAVKIEGRGKRGEKDAELVIMKAIGYTKGEEARQLSEAREFKGKETQEKLYTMMELQEGKELFRQLYANALTPGQLYEPGKPKRNKEKLTDAQKLMIAIKCCQSIQDLHNRGIIHGDVKPANFMADINGNQIVLGTIDFGFSFKLQPGQTSIQSDGIPLGTHTEYMPPEVKRVVDSSATKAEFSAKSDIYSLGKMFKEDLGLPDEICEKMLKSVAADRSNLPEIIRELADTLENKLAESTEANPEAQKLVSDVKNGVYQIKEHEGPKTRSTLVAQLLSGFRDPNDFTGSTKTSYYTVDEYKIFAAGLYARVPPETFFEQLVETLTDLTLDDNDRKVVLHNANILIRELVKANPEAKHLSETNKSLDGLLTAIKFLSADQFSDEIRQLQEIKANLEKNLATKKEVASAAQPTQTTQQKGIDEIIETITKTKKKSKRTVAETLIATELKKMQIDALAKINISDFHKLKWSKKKEGETLSSDAVSLTFNRISDMVVMDILNASSIKDQQKIYEFYLNVALKSLEQKDYQSAMAISAALERGPITRLKHLENKKRVVEKRAHLAGELSSNMSYKKLRMNYEQALAGNESFIPYLGVYQTDLTFTGDGNPDMVRGKTNETKILQEGAIISKIQQVINSAKDHEGKPCQTNLQSRIFRAKFTDDELYDKSNIFYARNPVDLSNIKSLSDVTSAFPLGSIQTILRIKIGDDEFQGKKAFNKLFDMVMPLYENPSLVDKYPEATALKILNSMEKWAKNNNMYKGNIREEIEKARNGLSPTPLEKSQMTQLDKREKEDIARYAVADAEQRAQIREELTQFKATSAEHIKNSIDKIIMNLNVLDQITKFSAEINEIIAKPKDEAQDIHERYAQLARLSDIGKAIIPHAGSTNLIIQQEAQKVRDTLYSETMTELTKSLTDEAIAGLEGMPALYKDLLIERHRNKDDKSIGAKIKVITEVLSILQKDPNQHVKDNAKSTYEIIVNKLTKLDKCQKFSDPSTTEEQKNSIARDILMLSKDDNVLVNNWAQQLLNETPGLKDRIQQVSDLDIQKAKQAEFEIKNQSKLLIKNLNSADGYKTVDRAKIDQKIKELQKQLDDIEKGPFEAASKVATTAKENIQPCIENLTKLLAHIEKMKGTPIEGAELTVKELIQKLEDSLSPSKATPRASTALTEEQAEEQTIKTRPRATHAESPPVYIDPQLEKRESTTVDQQSTVVSVPTTAANDSIPIPLQVDSPENIAALSDLLAQKLVHTSSLVDEQIGQPERNPGSPPTEHLAVLKGKTDTEPLSTPLSSAIDEETPLTVLSTQSTSVLTNSIDPIVDPSRSTTSPIAKSKANNVIDQEEQGIDTAKPNRARANSMPSIPTVPKQTEDDSAPKKRAMSLSTHTDKPVWKEPPTRVVSKPIVPSHSKPSTALVQPMKKRARQDLLGKARANAKNEALRNATSSVVVTPNVLTDPSKLTSTVIPQTGELPSSPTVGISVATAQSNTPSNSPIVSSPIVPNTSETPVVTNTSVQQSGTVLPSSRPPTRHTPHLHTSGFPPLVSDEFSHTQNLSLQQLYDFAQNHQQDFDIKEIKKFPDQQQVGLKGLEFVFKRDDSTNKPVSAYATKGENQNIKFSVSKSLYANDQSAAAEAVLKMCRLAVNAAEPNTIFTIPENMSPPEKREMVNACFKKAIQEALEKPGTKFTAETIPKVVDKAEGPKRDTRPGGVV